MVFDFKGNQNGFIDLKGNTIFVDESKIVG